MPYIKRLVKHKENDLTPPLFVLQNLCNLNFKSSVWQLIRAQTDMSHYDIQHLVGQAVDLEIQRQNQREQGKI